MTKSSIEFGQLIYVRTSDGSGVPGMLILHSIRGTIIYKNTNFFGVPDPLINRFYKESIDQSL